MKAWLLQRFGLSRLALCERPRPVIGLGQVRVKLGYAALNYRDYLVIEGRYNPRLRLPLVPGSDAVGRVVAVGEEVTSVAVGDRVVPLFAQRWQAGETDRRTLRATLGGPLDGVLTEQTLLSEEGLARVPDYLTDVEAATLPCAALTAWSALTQQTPVKPGDVVLVQGTGGVSTFAILFARAFGATVVVTSRHDEKLARAKEWGAAFGINSQRDKDWGRTAREWTGGRGVDQVIEVGGSGTMPQSLRAVRPFGTISLIGNLAGGSAKVDLTPALMNNVRIQGVFVGHRQAFEAMCRALEATRIRPVIDSIFEFEEVPQAFEYLVNGTHLGKVCVRIGGGTTPEG